MKRTKQLLPWGNNSLLQHVIQTVKKSDLDELFLVLGASSTKIRQRTDLSEVQVIENKQWKAGLGSSIAKGIEILSRQGQFDACLILLADQPFITVDYLNEMINAYKADVIIASGYQGKAGVPCLFPRRFFSDLMALEGDRGANRLLNDPNTPVDILAVPTDLKDIDTLEAYQKWYPK